MRILERYTLRAYLPSLLWCLGIFVGLYLVLDLLGHLDEILRNRIPGMLLLTYYGMTVPLVFVQVAPFACLMATLYTLGNLNRHQEVMAMRASGIGPLKIIGPFLWVGLLLSGLLLLVNETLAPKAALTTYAIKQNYLERAADPKSAQHRVLKTIQHLAAYGHGHTLLYAKSFDPVEKKMEGIVILQHGPHLALRRKITAESAAWTGISWRFEKGTILQFNAKGEAIGRPVAFEAKTIQAGDRPEVLEKSEAQAAFMNTEDLLRYIERFQGAGGAMIRKLKSDLYAKWAGAFAPLILTLVGIPFAIQPIRGGTFLGLSLGLGVGLAFYGANALMVALGKGGWLPPFIAAWAAPVGFALFGAGQANRRLA
jgi:lipopolysaccharide export system permease protein